MTLSRIRDLAPQRWDRIRNTSRKEGFIHVDDQCQKLEVSPATIHRDLEELERLGHIRRVHGGARKAGKTSFAHAGACQDIDVLITNKGFPEDMANELIALNIKVIET